MRQIQAFVPCAVAALTLGVAASSAATVDTWWVGGEVRLAEPSNLDTDVAFDLQSGVANGGEIIAPGFDPGTSRRFRGGWKDRDAARNSYSLSWWSWDGGDSVSEGGGVRPILGDPFFANTFADRVESEVDVRVSILDVVASRRITATKRSTWWWNAGIRRAGFEERWTTQYFDAGTPVAGPEEVVEIDVDAKGLGLTAGVDATFTWHSRWRANLGVKLAMLRGETEASYHDRGFDDNVTMTFQTSVIDQTEDRLFQQVELEAEVSFSILPALDVHLGYWLLNWDEAVQVGRVLDDVQGGVLSARDDLAFDGLVVGATWRIE